ncbi:MAG: FHA domain-containing protein [Archangiaceae bacterium]|nr:FHA domain-containing protein [Archangiaceae bacterium]
MPTLVIKNPDGTEQEQDFAGQLTIGRADGNDLVLAEGGVSRKHARFYTEGSAVMVEDTGSANGTWVDGEKIEAPTRLGTRAQVVIGDYEISVKGNGVRAGSKSPSGSRPKPPHNPERQTTAGQAVKPPRATKMVKAVQDPAAGAALARRSRPASAAGGGSSGPSLRGLTGPWLNKTFPLKGTMVVGRVPGVDIQIEDDSVSRRHAELVVQGRDVVLRDLGSANGTNVNGAPLNEELALAAGDIIQFGVVEMTFEVPLPVVTRRGARGGRAPAPDEGGEGPGEGGGKKKLIIGGVVVLTLLLAGVGVKVLMGNAGSAPPPPPPTQNEMTLDQWLEIARSNASPDLAEPNWDRALEAVNKALELEPIHPEANELKRRIVKERACKEAFDRGVKAMRLREDEALEAFAKITEDCSYFFKVKPKIKEAVEQVMKKNKETCDTYVSNGSWKEALPVCQKYVEFACQDMTPEQLYPAATQAMCIGATGKKARGCFMPKDKTYVKFLQAREKNDPGAPLWRCPELPIFRKPKPPPDLGAAAKEDIRKRSADKEVAEAVVLYFDGKDAEATNTLQRLLEKAEKAKAHVQAKQVQRDIAEVMGLFKEGSTEISKGEPERAEEPFKEALVVDERLVLGPEKAALPEAEKKTDLERFKSYVRKNIQHDMAAACYEKGKNFMDRKDEKRACKLWRMGFWFYKGDSNLLKAVTNVCTQKAHEMLESSSDCQALSRVLDYEVPGDGTKEAYEQKKIELKCP